MIIGLLKEPAHETRVSLLPEAVATLTKKGITVFIENNAGEKAFAANGDYEKVGGQIKSAEEIIQSSDIILSIHRPELAHVLPKNKILVGVYQPLYDPSLMQEWAQQGITTFSLDLLPRTTRAQSMDVLSSQANI